MKKVLLVYKTKYGSTKKYSEWIKEELNCDIIPYDDFKSKMVEAYDLIIYGGGVHAGGIKGFDTFQKVIKKYRGEKKFIIFACGMNVENFDQRAELRDVNFSKDYLKGLTCYYLNGNFDPALVSGIDKKILAWSRKILLSKGKLNFTKEDKILLDRMDNGYKGLDRNNILKLVQDIKEEINEG